MKVRRAELTDLRQLIELFNEMHEESDIVSAEAQQTLIEVLAESNRAVLVAEIDGVVVGTVDVAVHGNLSRGMKPWAIVENVMVTEAARRKGVARALMTSAEHFARESGCYKIQLVSGIENHASHHLYRLLGYDIPVLGFRKRL
jgi:GNAT superfamily N-acetyltransferase